MNVLRLLMVPLIVCVCLGCGNDSKPPAAAPPPPFIPASDALTEKAASDDARTVAPAGAAPTDKVENAVAADESPEADMNEEVSNTEETPPSAPEETADKDDSEAPPSVAADESNVESDESDRDEPAATSEPGSPDPVTDPVAEKPAKANSGKWMRGLSKALSRAASKTLGGAAQSTKAAPKRPEAEDDPFPDGEPNEEKPKE